MIAFAKSDQDLSSVAAERLDAAGYESALAKARRVLDADPAPPLDVIIHGVGARLHTNSPHWRRFWSANWFASNQWATLTGASPPAEPRVHLYAIFPETETTPWVGYSLAHATVFFTGATAYGPLRVLALSAVARHLAEEEAVHFVPGICVNRNGQGILFLHPLGSAWETTVPAVMEIAGSRLVAVDGLFIRYGLVRMVDGVTLLPTRVIEEKGPEIRGYRLFPWLDEFGFLEPRADAQCLTLDGEDVYCFARDLDLGRAPDAMAFPLEQAWYVPTQIVAVEPGLVGPLWRGPEPEVGGFLENVPPFTPELWDQYGGWATEIVAAFGEGTARSTRLLLEEIGEEKVAEALCRLRAPSQARAMVVPEQLWSGRAGGHPWRPLRIEQVALLDGGRLRRLGPSELTERLSGTLSDPYGLFEGEITQILTGMLGRAVGQTG